MADPLILAQGWWDRSQRDPSYLTILQRKVDEIDDGIVNGTITGDIVQAGKNGANYTQRTNYSLQERLGAMRWAIESIKTGVRPSRNRRIMF
jgi:hypothetical protein